MSLRLPGTYAALIDENQTPLARFLAWKKMQFSNIPYAVTDGTVYLLKSIG